MIFLSGWGFLPTVAGCHMNRSRIKTMLVCLAVFVLAVAAGVGGLVWLALSRSESQWRAQEQYLSDRSADVLADSRRLMAEAGSDPILLPVKALPDSLRVPGLRLVQVQQDHLTLVVYTSPDTTSGFRVWSRKPSSGFQDMPTALPFVTRFSYCNDYPVSPTNRP